MGNKCDHKKVYASFEYATNPPQRPWICEKCGERGVDVTGKLLSAPSYEDLIRKFYGN